ncbi:MAG: hypothetical protein WAM24_23455 [Ignavibacteriaceae bacterium]
MLLQAALSRGTPTKPGSESAIVIIADYRGMNRLNFKPSENKVVHSQSKSGSEQLNMV